MRFALFSLLLVAYAKSMANGFMLPGAPAMPYGQYRFQSGDFSCETPAASGGAYLDYGAFGKQANGSSASRINQALSQHGGGPNNFQANDVGVYIRAIVPLDRVKGIDCNRYFELELERKRLELEIMQSESNQRKSIVGGGMEFKKSGQ